MNANNGPVLKPNSFFPVPKVVGFGEPFGGY